MKEFLHDRRVQVGMAIWIFFLLFAFIGPLILTWMGRSASDVDFNHLGVGPSSAHWLGTTNTGEDVVNQLVYGAQGSVLTGLLVGVFATAIATVMGLVGAYLGGAADTTLNGLTNLALTISGFPLLIVIAAYIPKVGIIGIAIAISVVSWAGGARNVRAQTLSLRRREYVVAMRMAGESRTRLMFSEVMPHLLPGDLGDRDRLCHRRCALAGRTGLHRSRGRQRQLGHHDRRGAAGRGHRPGPVVVVPAARTLHRAARHRPGPGQLRR